MRKQCLLITIFLCGFMLNSAHADFASVDDDFDISFPCVAFRGGNYRMNISYEPALSIRDGHYWKFQDSSPAGWSEECMPVGDDLKLRVPRAEYGGSNYRMTLDYRGEVDPWDGLYWELGSLVETAISTKVRDTAPDFTTDDLKELISGLTSFTLDFYQTIQKDQSGNLFFSPYSISTALAMTHPGARGETASQMAAALHFILPDSRLAHTSNALDFLLTDLVEGLGRHGETEFRLNVANSLWGQKGWYFVPAYLDTLAEHYGAALGLLDFINSPEPSRIVINDWVADETEDKITDLIPPGAVTSLTRLVLTNAIHFNAAWTIPFEETATAVEPFYLLDGGSATASMMKQTDVFRYAEGENYQAVEMNYKGNDFSMVVILPSEGRFESFESSLDKVGLDAILGALDRTTVDLKLPRFNHAGGAISLKSALSDLGMPVAFTDAADFSGIDGSTDLSISDVLHKTFISVDETGTEAAAATAVVIVGSGMPSEPVEMHINRPFIFLIRQTSAGPILFFGRILRPE